MKISKAREKLYSKAGFHQPIGLGRRPAVVVIDMQYTYTDPSSAVGSSRLQPTINSVQKLLKVARRRKIPVLYVTTKHRRDGLDMGLLQRKIKFLHRHLIEGTRWVEIDEQVKPKPGDFMIVKKTTDAFSYTPLDLILRNLGVDTLLITGCSTSACIRATVESAHKLGYRPIIPMECTNDRDSEAHEYHLFDMNAKYADVLSLARVVRYLNGLRRVSYNSPSRN